MRTRLLLLLAFSAACSAPPAPTPTSSASPMPPVHPTASAPPSPALAPASRDLRVLDAGFGGVGPVAPPGAVNAWVIVMLEVWSPAADLAGVHAVAVTLLDAKGGVVARALAPIEVQVVPTRQRPPRDLSDTDATPFDGRVPKGAVVVLRVHAALDTRVEKLWKAGADTRARVELVDAEGVHATASAPAYQWPTG